MYILLYIFIIVFVYYLFTDRNSEKIAVIKAYLEASKMLRNYDDPSQDPVFSEVTALDLSHVVSSISGPKRPHDRISVFEAKDDFLTCLTNKVSQFYFGNKQNKIVQSIIISHSLLNVSDLFKQYVYQFTIIIR